MQQARTGLASSSILAIILIIILMATAFTVDSRSTNVKSSALPSISTNISAPWNSRPDTVMRTPTLIPDSTFTLHPTNTATSIPAYAPSPSPTPLLPQISGQVECDFWGDGGWCTGNESLRLTAGNLQGFTATISGELNGVPFSCGSSCSLPLPEGMGTASYTVTSASGRTATGSSTWRRDSTPPVLKIVLPPIDGMNGWHVSELDVSANASDATSGLYSVEGIIDEGGNWLSLPIHISDEVHPIAIRARDVAGNETMATDVIYIDAIPPVAQFTSHLNGEVVQGKVTLAGKLEDETSNSAGGEISLNGITWQTVSMDTSEAWSYTWNTATLPDGQYSLLIRGIDEAGNLGDAAQITLFVENRPPLVSLTERNPPYPQPLKR